MPNVGRASKRDRTTIVEEGPRTMLVKDTYIPEADPHETKARRALKVNFPLDVLQIDAMRKQDGQFESHPQGKVTEIDP
ncbi:hypothetical protein D3C87_2090390 [compost metagenome]